MNQEGMRQDFSGAEIAPGARPGQSRAVKRSWRDAHLYQLGIQPFDVNRRLLIYPSWRMGPAALSSCNFCVFVPAQHDGIPWCGCHHARCTGNTGTEVPYTGIAHSHRGSIIAY